MIALGFAMILVGFALMSPRSGASRSTTSQNVSMGWWRMPSNAGDEGQGWTPWRIRVLQIVGGLVLMVAGVALIATL